MNIENLTELHVLFENCEQIVVPAKDVVYFHVTGITESLRFNNILREEVVDKEQHKHADFVTLTIANKPEYHRIFHYDDIARIHFYSSAGQADWFFVDWVGGPDTNTLQKTGEDDGEIIVTIGGRR